MKAWVARRAYSVEQQYQRLNFVASRPGPVVEAARVNGMQLAVGGFA